MKKNKNGAELSQVQFNMSQLNWLQSAMIIYLGQLLACFYPSMQPVPRDSFTTKNKKKKKMYTGKKEEREDIRTKNERKNKK